MKLTDNQKNEIRQIISSPVHECNEYTEVKIQSLFEEIERIATNLKNVPDKFQNIDIVKTVNDYVKANISIRKQYFDGMENGFFDIDEKYYRTAHAALFKGEAMCAGFIESLRCLLIAFDYKSFTLISKLPGSNKRLLHYVCAIERDNEWIILDPERQASCERKGYDFNSYQNGMIYIVPGDDFAIEKIGKDGVGPKANEYLQRSDTIFCQGLSGLKDMMNTNYVKKEKLYD